MSKKLLLALLSVLIFTFACTKKQDTPTKTVEKFFNAFGKNDFKTADTYFINPRYTDMQEDEKTFIEELNKKGFKADNITLDSEDNQSAIVKLNITTVDMNYVIKKYTEYEAQKLNDDVEGNEINDADQSQKAFLDIVKNPETPLATSHIYVSLKKVDNKWLIEDIVNDEVTMYDEEISIDFKKVGEDTKDAIFMLGDMGNSSCAFQTGDGDLLIMECNEEDIAALEGTKGDSLIIVYEVLKADDDPREYYKLKEHKHKGDAQKTKDKPKAQAPAKTLDKPQTPKQDTK